MESCDHTWRRPSQLRVGFMCLRLLFPACEHTNADMVALLLRSGAQVNRLCSQGAGVLHEACRHGSVSICSMLLEAGVDLHTRNVYGIQPFFVSAQHGYSELLQLLARRGGSSGTKLSFSFLGQRRNL